MRRVSVIASAAVLLSCAAALASATCPEEQSTPQQPTDPALCKALLPAVQNPSQLPLNEYEAVLGQYLEAMCHRDLDGGWKVDKRVRDTGPWIGSYRAG